MANQILIARCYDCQNKCIDLQIDRNNPRKYCDDEAEFPILLEWLDKAVILKKIEETRCPECNGNQWYLTDKTEH